MFIFDSFFYFVMNVCFCFCRIFWNFLEDGMLWVDKFVNNYLSIKLLVFKIFYIVGIKNICVN